MVHCSGNNVKERSYDRQYRVLGDSDGQGGHKRGQKCKPLQNRTKNQPFCIALHRARPTPYFLYFFKAIVAAYHPLSRALFGVKFY